MNEESYLLDTCVIICTARMEPLKASAIMALESASRRNAIIISPVSAWELGILAASGRVVLAADPLKFFVEFAERPGLFLCELSSEILIRSSFLPELKHKDPMDRLLIATARHFGYTLVTSDRAILAYGALGHVKTLAC